MVDSSAAFAGITYRSLVPRSARINTGGLLTDICHTQAQRLVALAAFESRFYLHRRSQQNLRGATEVRPAPEGSAGRAGRLSCKKRRLRT